MKSLMTLLIVATTVVTSTAHAQVRVVRYDDDRLTGITEVDVVVRISNQAADACAAPRDPLQSTARETLRAAGVTATVSDRSSSWFHSVIVNIISARAGSNCVASVTADLVAEVHGMPEADLGRPPGAWGSLLVGHMPLLSSAELVIAPISEHDSAVRAAVRGQITAMTTRLRAVNP
jgi:hypothetical protein